MKHNNTKFSKEQKLKITAALLVALSGILAGIVELFSKCCCDKSADGSLCVIKIILLVLNVAAVLAALCSDIIGIVTYIKTQKVQDDIKCKAYRNEEELTTLQDFEAWVQGKKDITLHLMTETTTKEEPKTEEEKNDKGNKSNNKIFYCSLITTAISFITLLASVVVLAIV